MKTYEDLVKLSDYDERLKYLQTFSAVGIETFGKDRWLNQEVYRSEEFKMARRKAILRDNGCDMGIPTLPIEGKIIVHHINPITVDDVVNHPERVFDLNNLICVSFETHNQIHYGKKKTNVWVKRQKNDTIPWR